MNNKGTKSNKLNNEKVFVNRTFKNSHSDNDEIKATI